MNVPMDIEDGETEVIIVNGGMKRTGDVQPT